MKKNLVKTLESPSATPMVVPGADTETITCSDSMRFIKDSMYRPAKYSPVLVEVLISVSRGNGSVLANIKRTEQVSVCSEDDDPSVCPPWRFEGMTRLCFFSIQLTTYFQGLSQESGSSHPVDWKHSRSSYATQEVSF